MKKRRLFLIIPAALLLSAPFAAESRQPKSSTPTASSVHATPRINIPTQVKPLALPEFRTVKLPADIAAKETFDELSARKGDTDPMEWLRVYYLIVSDSASVKIANYSRNRQMALTAADNYLNARNPSPQELEHDYHAIAEALPEMNPVQGIHSHEWIIATRALSRYCTAAATADTIITPQDAIVFANFCKGLGVRANTAAISGLSHFLKHDYEEAAEIFGNLWERYTDKLDETSREEYASRIKTLRERRGILDIYRKSLEAAGATQKLATLLASPVYADVMKD